MLEVLVSVRGWVRARHPPSSSPKLTIDDLPLSSKKGRVFLSSDIESMAAPPAAATGIFLLLLIAAPPATASDDTNHVYSPCSDAKVQRSDGFTFGLAFSRRDSFFSSGNGSQAVQLSPCDSRLGLAGSSAQLAVFRAKVDEISLLTVNTTASSFRPVRDPRFFDWMYICSSFVGVDLFVYNAFFLEFTIRNSRVCCCGSLFLLQFVLCSVASLWKGLILYMDYEPYI